VKDIRKFLGLANYYRRFIKNFARVARPVMNIEWDYNYYQPWSDNEWLVDKMLAMLDEDIIMQ